MKELVARKKYQCEDLGNFVETIYIALYIFI